MSTIVPNTNKRTISVKPLSLSLVSNHENIRAEQLFTMFESLPWSMWLDSCNSNHVDSQYDILVWQPEITLTTQGEKTTVTYRDSDLNDTNTVISHEDPLQLLNNIQCEHFKNSFIKKYITLESSGAIISNNEGTLGEANKNLNLPFFLGAVGYFSYDLGRRFEKITIKSKHDLTLDQMAVGIYDQAIIFDQKTNEFYLVCHEDQRGKIEAEILRLSKEKEALKSSQNFKLTSSWQSNIDKTNYVNKFNQIQEYLLSGDCYQINLAQRFTAQYQGNEFKAYTALRESNNAPFSAFLRFENNAVLSISPERFLQLNEQKVQSKPIKGTKPRSSNPIFDEKNAKALKRSEKDRAENLMIVDLLRNDISKVCQPGTVKVPLLFDIESFPAVHHLVSTVEGELESQYSAHDLLRASFPGGSITGAPKIRAMEIIEELEPNNRSIYCGSIGYISQCGNMDTSITIRTLVCDNNNIYCWAGGGIVADSNAEAEYQETFDKVNKILPILSAL